MKYILSFLPEVAAAAKGLFMTFTSVRRKGKSKIEDYDDEERWDRKREMAQSAFFFSFSLMQKRRKVHLSKPGICLSNSSKVHLHTAFSGIVYAMQCCSELRKQKGRELRPLFSLFPISHHYLDQCTFSVRKIEVSHASEKKREKWNVSQRKSISFLCIRRGREFGALDYDG